MEPLPSNIALLRANVARNRLPVRIFPAAAGVENGRARFFVGTVTENSSLIQREGVAAGTMEVDTITVDKILEQMGWDSVDLLKVAIERIRENAVCGVPLLARASGPHGGRAARWLQPRSSPPGSRAV